MAILATVATVASSRPAFNASRVARAGKEVSVSPPRPLVPSHEIALTTFDTTDALLPLDSNAPSAEPQSEMSLLPVRAMLRNGAVAPEGVVPAVDNPYALLLSTETALKETPSSVRQESFDVYTSQTTRADGIPTSGDQSLNAKPGDPYFDAFSYLPETGPNAFPSPLEAYLQQVTAVPGS